MPEIVQQTLSGGTQLLVDIEELQETPRTMLWCAECEEFVLRSRRWDHDHELVEVDEIEDEENDTDPPEEVGTVWDITLDYTVTYRFRIPAYTKYQAEERAKELSWDASPVDSYHVHTDRREVETIMSDDHRLPDDWDPYGDTRIWEVFGNEG